MPENTPPSFVQEPLPPVDLSSSSLDKRASELARYACADHIQSHYPMHKQLNVMRAGTEAEKDKMDAFINACRDWSNGENPDPAELEGIQP